MLVLLLLLQQQGRQQQPVLCHSPHALSLYDISGNEQRICQQ